MQQVIPDWCNGGKLRRRRLIVDKWQDVVNDEQARLIKQALKDMEVQWPVMSGGMNNNSSTCPGGAELKFYPKGTLSQWEEMVERITSYNQIGVG